MAVTTHPEGVSIAWLHIATPAAMGERPSVLSDEDPHPAVVYSVVTTSPEGIAVSRHWVPVISPHSWSVSLFAFSESVYTRFPDVVSAGGCLKSWSVAPLSSASPGNSG